MKQFLRYSSEKIWKLEQNFRSKYFQNNFHKKLDKNVSSTIVPEIIETRKNLHAEKENKKV